MNVRTGTSREFRMWLSGQFYTQTGSVIGGQALEDGIRILEAQAVNDGPQYQPFIRVGRDCKKLILDLCDVRWRVVEMTADGWFVVGRTNAKKDDRDLVLSASNSWMLAFDNLSSVPACCRRAVPACDRKRLCDTHAAHRPQ